MNKKRQKFSLRLLPNKFLFCFGFWRCWLRCLKIESFYFSCCFFNFNFHCYGFVVIRIEFLMLDTFSSAFFMLSTNPWQSGNSTQSRWAQLDLKQLNHREEKSISIDGKRGKCNWHESCFDGYRCGCLKQTPNHNSTNFFLTFFWLPIIWDKINNFFFFKNLDETKKNEENTKPNKLY